MQLWLDTIDPETIDEAHNLGLLHGVTTNPSILSQADEPLENILDDLLNRQPGPITVQVTASTTPEMIEQAKDIYDYSQRLIIKIPAAFALVDYPPTFGASVHLCPPLIQ